MYVTKYGEKQFYMSQYISPLFLSNYRLTKKSAVCLYSNVEPSLPITCVALHTRV